MREITEHPGRASGQDRKEGFIRENLGNTAKISSSKKGKSLNWEKKCDKIVTTPSACQEGKKRKERINP